VSVRVGGRASLRGRVSVRDGGRASFRGRVSVRVRVGGRIASPMSIDLLPRKRLSTLSR
jgi:hypothetical protein